MIRPGDIVHHRPTGETWIVAGVNENNGTLVPKGYPFPTVGKISDCDLIEAKGEPQDESVREAFRTLGMIGYIENGMAAPQEEKQPSRWIRCEDRQPEAVGTYMVQRRKKGQTDCIRSAANWDGDRWTSVNGYKLSTVEAWKEH